MNKIFILFAVMFLACNSLELTDDMQIIKNSAIVISDLSTLNDKIYEEVSEYEILMVGEMHGTNEPSEFVYGLCDLIGEKEGKVILGMEISPGQMDGFSDTMSSHQISEMKFFAGENSSGMNGESWLNLITKSNQNTNIIIKFIDYQRESPRDSSMYNAICDIRKEYPKTKIVTLTGNLHNWLEPFKDQLMLGGYLVKDSINFESKKIMSIMHAYNQGTMLNNVGDGLELRTIEGKDNIFNRTISANRFICKKFDKRETHYTHVLYTDKVSHSKVLEDN